jgi:hypothetical protein
LLRLVFLVLIALDFGKSNQYFIFIHLPKKMHGPKPYLPSLGQCRTGAGLSAKLAYRVCKLSADRNAAATR